LKKIEEKDQLLEKLKDKNVIIGPQTLENNFSSPSNPCRGLSMVNTNLSFQNKNLIQSNFLNENINNSLDINLANNIINKEENNLVKNNENKVINKDENNLDKDNKNKVINKDENNENKSINKGFV